MHIHCSDCGTFCYSDDVAVWEGYMPKVMLDMEMPKSCSECRLPANMECYLAEWAIHRGFDSERRHPECPLQEVKE